MQLTEDHVAAGCRGSINIKSSPLPRICEPCNLFAIVEMTSVTVVFTHWIAPGNRIVSSNCTFGDLDCRAIKVLSIGEQWCSADVNALKAAAQNKVFEDVRTWGEFNFYLNSLRRKHPVSTRSGHTAGFVQLGT